MTLGNFSRDLEFALKEVSCNYFCNISKINYLLINGDAVADFSVYGYGNGICEIKEIYGYLRQYFSSLGYFVVGLYSQSTGLNPLQSVRGEFHIEINLHGKNIRVFCSYK